jgi:hypothetical protein
MGEHLDLLRMDFPPFIALLAAFQRLFGDSIVLIHIAPAAGHAALIVVTGAIARRVGGGMTAQLLAAFVVATAPVFLRAGALFQPVVFDQLWWTLALYLLLRIGQDQLRDPTTRRQDRQRSAAAALAFLLGSPSLAGQVVLGWPFLGQFSDLQGTQLSRVTPLGFTLEQFLMVGPLLLIAVVGAAWAISRRGDPGVRAVGWTAVSAFAIMLAAGGKAYYIAPIWPTLLAFGAARTERWLGRLRERRPLVAGTALGFAVIGLPMGLPFLPPEPMARYAAWLGVTQSVTTNTGERLELPQDYADMLGWKTLADSVVATWEELPVEDRERTVILATNYGRAGAIDFYAGDRIPHAVAPVGSYWFWGPGDRPGTITILVGAEPEDVVGIYFGRAELARRVRNPWGVPEERDVPITVARDPTLPLQEVWPAWRGVN